MKNARAGFGTQSATAQKLSSGRQTDRETYTTKTITHTALWVVTIAHDVFASMVLLDCIISVKLEEVVC